MISSIFSDTPNLISIITSMIDVFAIVVVAVSVFTTILPLIKNIVASSLPFIIRSYSDKRQQQQQTAKENNYVLRRRLVKDSFIKGLLFALELESANAILKIGIFTSSLVGITSITSSSASTSTFGINNFIFFIGIFSLRIAINQTLRRRFK